MINKNGKYYQLKQLWCMGIIFFKLCEYLTCIGYIANLILNKRGKQMINKFKEAISQYGLEINGSYAYGEINGYEINIKTYALNKPFPFNVHISFFATQEQRTQIESQLKQRVSKFFNYSITYYGISIALNDIHYGDSSKKLQNVFDYIFNILKTSDIKGIGYCPVCGRELDNLTKKRINVDNFTITLDEDCLNSINNSIEKENEDFQNAPNNYLKGFFGALIGGAVGFIVSFALYYLGFISAISAFVAFAVGISLYKKFGGKPNKMMILIVSVISIAFLLLSIFAVYIVAAASIAITEGLAMNAFEIFAICLKDSKFTLIFLSDLGLTLLFSAISIVLESVKLSKQIKRPKKIKIII